MKKYFLKSEVLSADKGGKLTEKPISKPELVAKPLPQSRTATPAEKRAIQGKQRIPSKTFMDDEWNRDEYVPPDKITEEDYEYFQYIEKEKQERERRAREQEKERIQKFKELRQEIVWNNDTIEQGEEKHEMQVEEEANDKGESNKQLILPVVKTGPKLGSKGTTIKAEKRKAVAQEEKTEPVPKKAAVTEDAKSVLDKLCNYESSDDNDL